MQLLRPARWLGICLLAVLGVWAGWQTPAARAEVVWVPSSPGVTPMGAIKAGFTSQSDLLVCRAKVEGHWWVGQAHDGGCHLALMGRAMTRDQYQVLVERPQERWEKYFSQVPAGAVRGGYSPEGDLYVCRGRYRDGVHIGKLVGRRCLIGWGGKEVEISPFEVLVGRDLIWRQTHRGVLPPEAVMGGQVGYRPLYVCRARYRDGVHPGKLWLGRCHLGWGGGEYILDEFEVLIRSSSVIWVAARAQALPAECLGSTPESGGQGCICRGRHGEGLFAGQVREGRCQVTYQGKAVPLENFEVLVIR